MRPTVELVNAVKCPACGGELYVQFDYDAMYVSGLCQSCNKILAKVRIGDSLYETAYRLNSELKARSISYVQDVASCEEIDNFLGV